VRVALVTGIYPPDIGGPATHATDLRKELMSRGHPVTVLTLWDGRGTDRTADVVRFPRLWPWPLRLGAVAWWLLEHRDRYDVVYATGLLPAAVAGARLAGRPVVVKVVGDAAWERGRRQGLTDRDFDDFQGSQGGPLRLRSMRWVRDWSLRRSTAITAPTEYLAGIVERWLDGPADVTVVPNGVRSPGRRRARRSGTAPLRAMFVGRLVPHKRVELLLEAIAATEGVTLDVVGDGPERARLETCARELDLDDRVTFAGPVPQEEVMRRLAGADALLLASDYEGLPHAAIEALAWGVPLIAPPVGGTGDALRDERTGLVVEDVTAPAFSRALTRLRDDPDLRRRLSRGARRSAAGWRIERTVDQVENLLARARAGKPRAVFLGKTSIPSVLEPDARRKVSILARHLETTILGLGRPGVGWLGRVRTVRFPAVRPPALGGVLFYSLGPVVAVSMSIGRRRCTIVCQSPYEAFGTIALTRLLPGRFRPPVVVEVHGDWRAGTSLYGSPVRRLVARPADAAARWAVRRADRVRAIGRYTEALARGAGYAGETDRFVTFSDFSMFLETPAVPPPAEPAVAFVGALEGSKGVDTLLEAWPAVLQRFPDARLLVAGDGGARDRLRGTARRLGLDGGVRFLGSLSRGEVRALLDDSSLLALPSRSEGLGRVVLEAMARGRPVVASRVGGIPEVVEDGVTGFLVPPGDPGALGQAIVRLLEDPDRLVTMGNAGRRRVVALDPAGSFDAGIARLSAWISAR
jgi:glycosyltransferase involved in cell wall biosynthesis